MSSTASAQVSFAAALHRLRAWRRANDWTPHRFATEAGVPEAVTRQMDDAAWSPNLRTLEKLESVIPKGWRAGDPVPTARGKARAA